MLSLYRAALAIRRVHPGLGDGPKRWLEAGPGVLAYIRGECLAVVTNLSAEPIALPVAGELLLASADLEGGRLPPDASAWIGIDHDSLARHAGWPTREAE